MFTSEDYLYGWLFYIISGLVFFACWWYLTAKIRYSIMRNGLRLIALVVMFFPWRASPDLDYLAPAVVMAGVEGIFDGGDAFWRAGGPLLTAVGVALLIGLVVAAFLRLRNSGS